MGREEEEAFVPDAVDDDGDVNDDEANGPSFFLPLFSYNDLFNLFPSTPCNLLTAGEPHHQNIQQIHKKNLKSSFYPMHYFMKGKI